LVSAALANPQGGRVATGSAAIASTPGRVDVNQSSNRVIINWQGFSIGPGEITRFNQPSAAAVALNRVTGGDPSTILGELSANGRVLLINPNGVLFGGGSRVDVAGLIATTANLSDDDFMAGRLNFALPSSAPTASVVNRGTITVADGGLVALVAPGVSNEGVIQARLGRVSLVSADRFTVDFHGDQLIQFALDDTVTHAVSAPDGVPLAAAVTNAGRIVANGGTVQMSANVASGVLDRVIDMSGVVEARTAREVDGAIVLDGGANGTVAVSGRLDATGRRSGQTGGTVTITGQHVGLFGGADVDASGAAGGGTVLVGGDQHGEGPLANAQATYVDPKAAIHADALQNGNGGTVVVWSNKYTNVNGTITARGGLQGGNGGNIETSSHGVLGVTGTVDASAPAGTAGKWLLDPTDVMIGAPSMNETAGPIFNPTGTPAQIDPAAITTALNMGTSVTVNTNVNNGQSGNITFAAGANINATPTGTPSTQTLTFTAAGNFDSSGASITLGGSGLTLQISAGTDVLLGAMSLGPSALSVSSTAGQIGQSAAITVGGTSSFTAPGQQISLLNPANSFTGALSLNNATVGGTSFNNVGVQASGALLLGSVTVDNGTLALTAGGGITQTAGGVLTQTNNFTGPVNLEAGSGPITLTNTGNKFFGDMNLTNTGNNPVSVTSSTSIALSSTTLGSSGIGGSLTLTTDQLSTPGTIGTITTAGGALTIQPFTASTNVTFGGVGGAGLRFTDAMRANYHGFTSFTIGSATGTGTVTLGANETALGANVGLTLQAGAGGGTVTMAGHAVTLTGTGALTLNAGNTVTTAAITLGSGALSVTAGTNTTVNGPIATAGSAVTLTGPITLAGPITLNTTLGGSSGATIDLAGPVAAGGVALTMNAGTAGNISLQNVGSSGAPLASISILDAHDVTASGHIAVNTLTQSAGTGTTNFAGPGLSSTGAVTLTTNAIAGTYNVGSFTVTSGQTVATGSIAGTSGSAAAALASDPGSTGTQTFNGCTIGSGACATSGGGGGGGGGGITTTQAANATNTAQQVIGVLSQQSSPSDNPDDSNLHGFEVTIPTQNVDWSDPGGDLGIELAPEYQSLSRFFYSGECSTGIRSGRAATGEGCRQTDLRK